MTIDDLFAADDDNGNRRRQQADSILQSVNAGMKALANLYTTLEGAPSVQADAIPRNRRLASSRSRDSGNLATMVRIRTAAADSMARRRRSDKLADARIATMEHADSRAAEKQKTDTERADRLAQKRMAQVEAQTALANRRAEVAAAKARAAPATRRKSGGSTVVWIDPVSGERYSVDRGTWDKSSHSLFDMVVESTRPSPDSRGYPSAQEWERHCRDTYGRSRDTREAYIFRNLPGNSRALDYLKKMRNNK